MFALRLLYNSDKLSGYWMDVDLDNKIYNCSYEKNIDNHLWNGIIQLPTGCILYEENIYFNIKKDVILAYGVNKLGRFIIRLYQDENNDNLWNGYKSYYTDSMFKKLNLDEAKYRLQFNRAIVLTNENQDSYSDYKCLTLDNYTENEEDIKIKYKDRNKFLWYKLYDRKKRILLYNEKNEENSKKIKTEQENDYNNELNIIKNKLNEMNYELKLIICKQLKLLKKQNKLLVYKKKLKEYKKKFYSIFNCDGYLFCEEEKKMLIESFNSNRQGIIYLMRQNKTCCPFGVKEKRIDFKELSNDGFFLLYLILQRKCQFKFPSDFKISSSSSV